MDDKRTAFRKETLSRFLTMWHPTMTQDVKETIIAQYLYKTLPDMRIPQLEKVLGDILLAHGFTASDTNQEATPVMDEPKAVFKSTRTGPYSDIVDALDAKEPEPQGIEAIEAEILRIITEAEGSDRMPAQPMLEWLETGGFTCMRCNLIDHSQEDENGFSPIVASALVLTDAVIPEVLAQNLRLSMRLSDGRVPVDAINEW